MQQPQIILASASPRRRELLERLGLRFRVDPSDFPEDLSAGLPPEELVKQISRGKAAAVAPKYPHSIIIAADTIGVIRRRIIGKPQSPEDAGAMLRLLSGRSHRVITGLTIMDTSSGRELTCSVTTRVFFKALTPQEIDSYVATGEPLDKAGGYAIQGLGSILVEKIAGDFYNVIGLPLAALAEGLREFGIDVLREANNQVSFL